MRIAGKFESPATHFEPVQIIEMLCSLAIIVSILGQVMGQVLEGSFSELPFDWRSGQESSHSLISVPVIDFLNDTAVRFKWDLRTDDETARISTSFDIELSFGYFSDDFRNLISLPVKVPETYSNNSFSAIYTASGLQPTTSYRFRVCPQFSKGRGVCSLPLKVTTLANSVNYWEAVLSRRLSLAGSGRGFSNPVLQRPHLDTGVEVREQDISDNSMRFSDAVTSTTPVLPSGRRGHSLSLVDQAVYMFGGRTNGYTCATIYKDTIDLGNVNSGRDIYPCTHFQSEVSELWSFDVSTFQWVFLTAQANLLPPAREQHSATVINRDVYIYGGKTRIFRKGTDGENLYVHHRDVVLGDLWKLKVERARQFTLSFTKDSGLVHPGNQSIPEQGRLFAAIDGHNNVGVDASSDGLTPREGLCIDNVVVRVKIRHPCVNQIKVSITGPGPQSGSPNFHPPSSEQEVVLFSKLMTNGTGCVGGLHSFEFADSYSRRPDACCSQSYNGTYQPQGRLAEFVGASMVSTWTLLVQDLKADGIVGVLEDWEVEFSASPCVRTFQWQNISAPGAPPARYAARMITHGSSLFVYGGRDARDSALQDLYRYDTPTAKWTVLDPVSFDVAINPSSSVGANFALTSWGLLRYGGYYRQPVLPKDYGNYGSSVAVQDPVSLRWQEIDITDKSPLPRDATFGRTQPSSRYLSASVFIPSHALHWATKYTHHNIYDNLLPSSRTNYQGSVTDSLLMVGGFDGSTGSTVDGSSGGFLMDIWMLRLGNWSTPGMRDQQQQYLERNCRWRTNPAALNGTSATARCMSVVPHSKCEWRDLMLLPWCGGNNQTIA